jgi:hypothetical protein
VLILPRPNHNMDPNIVNSASFGLQWKIPFNTNEQVSKILTLILGVHESMMPNVWHSGGEIGDSAPSRSFHW